MDIKVPHEYKIPIYTRGYCMKDYMDYINIIYTHEYISIIWIHNYSIYTYIEVFTTQ